MLGDQVKRRKSSRGGKSKNKNQIKIAFYVFSGEKPA